MAPGRQRGKAEAHGRMTLGDSPMRGRLSSRRSGRRGVDTVEDNMEMEVYREMLSEVGSPLGDHHADKRRRVGERSGSRAVGLFGSESEAELGMDTPEKEAVMCSVEEPADTRVQTAFDMDASEDDEEGVEWENVEAQMAPVYGGQSPLEQRGEEHLQITLGREDTKGQHKATVRRRKPVTGAEKKRRLDVHKMHVLCLLSHVAMRNRWCNDEDVHKTLRRILPHTTILYLNPKPEGDQINRSTTFASGLKEAAEAFRRRFKITTPSMRRPYWREDPKIGGSSFALPQVVEVLQTIKDFRAQAMVLQGSRDLGAQLFCALLRAVGVEARLVCSLQVLPFSGVAPGENPKKPGKEYFVMSESETAGSSAGTRGNTPKTRNSSTPARSLGRPQFKSRTAASSRPSSRSGHPPSIIESAHPIYWVEAWNIAMQRWVCVDPLVTNTVNKSSRMEPPASDRFNNMNYVIAFEDDLSARDLTVRYVRAFNAKTLKNRVESTKDGEKWWYTTMQIFERPFLEDRDQIEIGELTSKANGEGMPKNVQDFKNHPIYVLERHLRRNEVIHPKHVAGMVGLSKATPAKKHQALETVHRRSDVHVVKSADGWYRLGRNVKAGEQPLKRVPAPRNKVTAMNDFFGEDSEGEEAQDTPMYAMFQTELYEPPPVVDGKVPKNNYGNIDVYTESMVPKGGFHLKHSDASLAARILGISYADAVTGFQFKGRHGTAITTGIVAAAEYREALSAVLEGLEDERAQEEEERRTRAALQMWKQLLTKLRVAERIESYTFEGDDVQKMDEVEGGGFLPEEGGFIPEAGNSVREAGEEDLLEPTRSISSRAESEMEDQPVAVDNREITYEPNLRSSSSQTPAGDFVRGLSAARQGASQNSSVFSQSSWKPKKIDKTQHYNLIVMSTTRRLMDEEPRENLSATTGSCSPLRPGPSSETVGPSSTTSVANPTPAENLVMSTPEESPNPPDPVQEDPESDWDKGSMLSEDPEDKDAIPYFLASP